MSSAWLLENLVAYSLQIGMVVGMAAFVPAALRLKMPGARLAYWQILLAACLLLPAVRPWRQQILAATVEVTSTITAVRPASTPAPRRMPSPNEVALGLLAAGVLARMAWLGVGFARLRGYRRRSLPLSPAPAWAVEADLRVSDEIVSPVTFGLRRPVILLPARFPALDAAMRDAILCHEVLHVRRRDWAFTLAEEVVRAVFWFHPAIWWLLGEIALAREQAVDRGVVAMTRTRDKYVDALLEIAGAGPGLDLAPAPLFLRRRHLKHRLVSILKEARMSKTSLCSALAAGLCFLGLACWLATATFPLSAAPQSVADAQGITVEMNGAQVIHRAPVVYPQRALQAAIEGAVTVEVKLDATGSVGDARVVAGPDELRKAALESVLKWHFTREVANSVRQVTIGFALPRRDGAQAGGAAGGVASGARGGIVAGVVGGVPGGIRGGVAGASFTMKPLKSIDTPGLSQAVRDELLARLPVHPGDTMDPETVAKIGAAMRDYDEHLSMSVRANDDGTVVQIAAPEAQPTSLPPERLRVGGSVQQTKLIRQPRPVYPLEAKEARIQGVVKLSAVIGKDGSIQTLEVLSGHPLLVPSAVESVKQWVYQPTLLNGNPVEVVTQIDVNYTLAQ